MSTVLFLPASPMVTHSVEAPENNVSYIILCALNNYTESPSDLVPLAFFPQYNGYIQFLLVKAVFEGSPREGRAFLCHADLSS
ncbi:hypothetical protein Tco_1342870 [Tanacetum coccineum]